MILPWQKRLWSQLLGRLEQFPHALLLTGSPGSGKREFARALAARLLCEKAGGEDFACGECLPCGWFAAGNHPDFRLIEPGGGEAGEENEESAPEVKPQRRSEQIRIDQVRALDNFLTIGTHRQKTKIVIIQPAETMNPSTANSLLKVLEEPNVTSLFILVSDNKRRILPTIRSRCQEIMFFKPEQAEALAWLHQKKIQRADELLAHVGGMPLEAETLAANADRLDQFVADLISIARSSPVAVAARWESWMKENKNGDSQLDKRTLAIWLQKWIYDLISIKIANRAVYHAGRRSQLSSVAGMTSVSALIDCYNEILRIVAVSLHPLNSRLYLEDMLSRYARAITSGR